MVSLIDINYQTRFCKFSIDFYSDLEFLPNMTSPGKNSLNTIKNCTQGSLAYASNGNTYILSGENKWISYSGNSSGGSSGETTPSEDIEPISKSYIESLFKDKE
ncbi:MAG: hypothetical protein HFH73_03465 [Lachnospiraceae bacterium]|jgi:hypothetical protein|nr:hypothetical protein [Lachnospiraceae bacterium]